MKKSIKENTAFNKKVIVYAYTKMNFGDDLLIKLLCDRYPNTQFFLYTYPQYRTVFSECKNIRILSNANIQSKVINRLGLLVGRKNVYERLIAKKCNACVCISGSFFIQRDDNWRSFLDYMCSRKVKGVPFFLLDSNFGPYEDEEFYKEFKKLFKTFKDICFRESYSYNLFSDLKNVRWAPDVVFSGRYPKQKSKKIVTISVINLDSRIDLKEYQNIYVEFILKQCALFSFEKYDIKLVSFCKEEGDEIMVDKLYMMLQRNQINAEKVYYRGDLMQVINLFAESEIILATRFHAMILGWCMKKKVIPIIYSDKTAHVLDDLKFDSFYLRIQDIEKINDMEFNNQIDSCCYTFPKKEEVFNQFYELDKIL